MTPGVHQEQQLLSTLETECQIKIISTASSTVERHLTGEILAD